MKIILFWSSYNKKVDKSLKYWRNKPLKITPFHYLPLLSHVKWKHNVDLYTYHNISKSYDDMLNGINLKDANTVFPAKQAFNALSRGNSIAHISDCVRLTASLNIDIFDNDTGIPLDMDTVAINPFPKDIHNGWFATSPAKVTGGVAYKWGKNHPPIVVHDQSWDGKALNMFPVIVNDVMKPEIYKLVQKIHTALNHPPIKNSKGWNYIMWSLGEMIKVDKRFVTCKPIIFCPVPGWLPSGKCYSLEFPTRLDGKTKVFGYLLPSINEILKNSITVQHYFESVYPFTNNPEVAMNFWLNVKEGSLLSKESRHILGSNWRNILNNYANDKRSG